MLSCGIEIFQISVTSLAYSPALFSVRGSSVYTYDGAKLHTISEPAKEKGKKVYNSSIFCAVWMKQTYIHRDSGHLVGHAIPADAPTRSLSQRDSSG